MCLQVLLLLDANPLQNEDPNSLVQLQRAASQTDPNDGQGTTIQKNIGGGSIGTGSVKQQKKKLRFMA